MRGTKCSHESSQMDESGNVYATVGHLDCMGCQFRPQLRMRGGRGTKYVEHFYFIFWTETG